MNKKSILSRSMILPILLLLLLLTSCTAQEANRVKEANTMTDWSPLTFDQMIANGDLDLIVLAEVTAVSPVTDTTREPIPIYVAGIEGTYTIQELHTLLSKKTSRSSL
ncbi:hypothetical protein [Marinicrinis sediminis]|uniref:Uncharacterized protein n=1 Tax=Marinicrinis sediminis TaxID=1652465 RepID=A0ABW5R533_9BACL